MYPRRGVVDNKYKCLIRFKYRLNGCIAGGVEIIGMEAQTAPTRAKGLVAPTLETVRTTLAFVIKLLKKQFLSTGRIRSVYERRLPEWCQCR